MQMRGILEPEGFTVLEADSGLSGLQVAKANQVDMFFIDVNMPIMSGIALIQQLRRLPEYIDTPMIILSTESSRKSRDKGKAVGTTYWMTKPVRPAKVLLGAKKFLGLLD